MGGFLCRKYRAYVIVIVKLTLPAAKGVSKQEIKQLV